MIRVSNCPWNLQWELQSKIIKMRRQKLSSFSCSSGNNFNWRNRTVRKSSMAPIQTVCSLPFEFLRGGKSQNRQWEISIARCSLGFNGCIRQPIWTDLRVASSHLCESHPNGCICLEVLSLPKVFQTFQNVVKSLNLSVGAGQDGCSSQNGLKTLGGWAFGHSWPLCLRLQFFESPLECSTSTHLSTANIKENIFHIQEQGKCVLTNFIYEETKGIFIPFSF